MLMRELQPGDVFLLNHYETNYIGVKIEVNPNIPRDGRGQAASIVYLFPEQFRGHTMTEDGFQLHHDKEVTKLNLGTNLC